MASNVNGNGKIFFFFESRVVTRKRFGFKVRMPMFWVFFFFRYCG